MGVSIGAGVGDREDWFAFDSVTGSPLQVENALLDQVLLANATGQFFGNSPGLGGGGAIGDVSRNGATVNNRLTRWDGVGATIQNSVVLVDDSGNMSGLGTITGGSGNVQITNATGNLIQAAIEQNGAATDQALIWNGAAFAPASVMLLPTTTPVTDNALAKFDLTTGKLVQNTGAILSDANAFTAGNGSAALPTYSFLSDPNTGMYRNSADALAWATAGTRRMLLSTSNLQGSDGSAPTPFYSFINDPDTGAFRISTNIYGISAGGVTIVQFRSAGIRSAINGTAASPSYSFVNDSDGGMFRQGGNSVGISAGGVECARFISNSLQILDGTTGDPSFSFINDTNTGVNRGTADHFEITCGGTNAAVFDSGGIESVNGSAGKPTYAFSSDTATGMFRNSANAIAWATAGVRRMLLSTSNLQGSDGSAGTPFYAFISDPNTGMLRVSSDILGFTTGGVLRLTIAGAVTTLVTKFAVVGTTTSIGLPNLTTTQQNALPNTAGTLIWNTSTGTVRVNNGAVWKDVP